MIFYCWPFSIQGTLTPCKLTAGHNEMDLLYIHPVKQHGDVAVVLTWLLRSSKTPLKQSRVRIILNKSQGQQYDTAYRRVRVCFQLTLWHALHGSQKKKKEQIELNNKPSPKKLLPLSRLHSTQTAPLVLFHQPSDLNFLSGHWGLYRVENVPTEWLQSIHFILP